MSKSKSTASGGLLLEDGSFWPGFAFGAKATKLGECVFHTGHTGYQEILTDPSYCRQILVFSAPQIGNQGFCAADFESQQIWASGCIVRDYSEAPYQWRKEKSLDQVLKEHHAPGLSGIDTRRLILHLRSAGNLWGVISTEMSELKKLQKFLKKGLSMEGLSLTQEVTTSKPYAWSEGSDALLIEALRLERSQNGYKKVVVMDFGVKRQILRYLIDCGFESVTVVPARTKAAEILAMKPDVVLLSNGPGDPAADREIIEEVKNLHGKVPLFGICLGHQILGLSLGLKTYKLKFGHHAANHPVKNLIRDHVEISSQNHGFAVELDPSGKSEIEATHINLNDQTLEGFRHRRLKISGIQYHPEAGPGPLDSVNLMQSFQQGSLV